MPKRGRPQRPYETSWGEVVPGLTKCGDGRWRIAQNEQRFTEHDERRAVERAKNILARLKPKELVHVEARIDVTPLELAASNGNAVNAALAKVNRTHDDNYFISSVDNTDEGITVAQVVEGAVLWPWLREQLIVRPQWVAMQVGIPELASLARFDLPKPPVPVKKVREGYKAHCTATEQSQNQALSSFNALVSFAAAKTLDDLTEEKLLAFRKHILSNPNLQSSDTIKAYFSRIGNVIRISARELDAVQVAQALARIKAKLYPPPNNVEDDPRPISRAHFHKLLNGVEQTDIPLVWRAMLLLALNCCLYMEDLCALKWEYLDLDKGTFVARRRKRGRCLRAAMLWPETIAALRALSRRGQSPYVFTSPLGTRYNKNTKINDFKDFREKVGVPDVTFSHIRDGAYTEAAHALGVDAKFAELLAGHSTGMKDRYVLRNPQIVKPATDAVYAAYFG